MLLRCLRCVCAVVVLSTLAVEGRTREYFVGVVEEEWDYAPGGGDLASFRSSDPAKAASAPRGHPLEMAVGRREEAKIQQTLQVGQRDLNQQSDWKIFLKPGPQRIGRKYIKAMYREFTDATFTTRKPREKWMGLLGPILMGEQGDVIKIVFKNMAVLAGRSFSMHPHGVQYSKENEGALYVDGTSGADKLDENVGPGQVYTMIWNVTDTASPTPDDPECLTWTYHSHINTVRDVNAGLIGILLTCRQGAEVKIKQDYAAQIAILLDVMDENESWYIDHNIRSYLGLTNTQAVEALKEDADFQESNKMHGINGVLYGHLQGIEACVGSTILWHLIGFGTEIDIHSLSISGHSFLHDQHRVDAISLNPVDFMTATMEVQTTGIWRIQCSVNDHLKAGMVAFLTAKNCGIRSSSGTMKVQNYKRFYIAIEEEDWNYGPSGNNVFDGGSLVQPGSESEQYFKKDSSRVGGTYRKALFREYEDVTFTKRKTRGPDEEHLGFLGPVLRLEVGDAVALTLSNNAGQPFSIHPHGASFVKMWEGSLYNDSSSDNEHLDDFVKPGQVSTTYWFIPDVMGPGPMDPPCITRVYTSSSRDRVRDAYSGLVGPILVCRSGALNDQLRQRQVDHEFFLMMSVTDENLSWYSDHNFQALTVDRSDEDFYNSNLMHSMNGYLYGNLPGLKMCLGDRVVWHVFSVGSERDIHTIYFHGQPLTQLDTHLSATYVLPGYFRTLLMKAENPGEWAAVCQTNDHYNAGAKALFSVSDCGLRRDYSIQFARGSQYRTFFLQAEEEMWDYAPSGMDKISGKNLSDPDHDGHIFTTAEGPYLGKVYKKVRYHQYTDQTFTTEIKRDASEEYLGILGPIIAAEAYDIITLVFRNNASRPYSVHAQGLFYKKNSEGTIYGAYRDGAVQPGETKIYEWSVPVDFAPAEGDSDCINQAYYSAVDPVRDTNSGLIGPLVICKPGALDKSGTRTDQTKPMVLLFEVIDEARSWYVDDNIKLFGNNASKDDPDFGESCLMHSINGYIYNNNPVMEVPQYGIVDWHLMSLGNDVDIHSVHFHGNEIVMFETGKHTKDVTQLFPGIFETVRMNATLAGQWLLHCHVHDHLTAGMETTYLVTPPAAAPTVDPFGFIGSN